MRVRTLCSLFTVALIFPTALHAGLSCADWMDQGNGTSWTICVDDNGVQRCYLVNNTPGSTAYEVACS